MNPSTQRRIRREAIRELDERLSALYKLRSDLFLAIEDADDFVEANARRWIRIQERIIRSHCAKYGLPRPHDVPED